MSFGEVLKKIRKDHKDSLAKLGEKLEVAATYIDKIEKGLSPVSENFFNKIIDIYYENIDELSLAYIEEKLPTTILDKLIYKNDRINFSTVSVKAQKFKSYQFDTASDGQLKNNYEIKELVIPSGTKITKDSFCIEIKGNDLEPQFYNDDIILIENDREVSWPILNKKIVVIDINGNKYLRRIEIVDYKPLFFALNNLYPPFLLTEEIKYVGTITKLLSRNMIPIKF